MRIFKEPDTRYRSSRRRCSVRKAIPRNFAKSTGKHLSQSFFLIKLQAATLSRKRPWRRCFSVNFANFPITPFFTEHLWATASVDPHDKASFCFEISSAWLFSQYWLIIFYSFQVVINRKFSWDSPSKKNFICVTESPLNGPQKMLFISS